VAKKKDNAVYATILLHRGKHMESLWVVKVRAKQYRVAAIPFYAYNISLGDIVLCEPDEDGVGLFIQHVIKKSGNRTVRVAFKASEGGNHPEALKLVTFLKEHGFRWDYNQVRLFSINIRSDEDYEKLKARLSEVPESAQMIWEDADPQPERSMEGEVVSVSESQASQ
jgi:hypothetical protein